MLADAIGREQTYLKSLDSRRTQGFHHQAMRNTIKILAVMTVVAWAAAVIFPLSGYLFGTGGGVTASVALMCALVLSYREEVVISTRGGPVYKENSKITFFMDYFIVGIIIFGLLLACTSNFIAELETVW
jgi:hypothetical protein